MYICIIPTLRSQIKKKLAELLLTDNNSKPPKLNILGHLWKAMNVQVNKLERNSIKIESVIKNQIGIISNTTKNFSLLLKKYLTNIKFS